MSWQQELPNQPENDGTLWWIRRKGTKTPPVFAKVTLARTNKAKYGNAWAILAMRFGDDALYLEPNNTDYEWQRVVPATED